MTITTAPLRTRHLKNGVTLSVYDRSQKLAGDRWLVSLHCEVEVPVRDEFWLEVGPVEAELGGRIREKAGDTLRYLVEQQRTFVAEADRSTLVADLLKSIEANAIRYFEAQRFPAGLFNKRFAEFKEQCLAEDRDRETLQPMAEDDGPADFSSCFSD